MGNDKDRSDGLQAKKGMTGAKKMSRKRGM